MPITSPAPSSACAAVVLCAERIRPTSLPDAGDSPSLSQAFHHRRGGAGGFREVQPRGGLFELLCSNPAFCCREHRGDITGILAIESFPDLCRTSMFSEVRAGSGQLTGGSPGVLRGIDRIEQVRRSTRLACFSKNPGFGDSEGKTGLRTSGHRTTACGPNRSKCLVELLQLSLLRKEERTSSALRRRRASGLSVANPPIIIIILPSATLSTCRHPHCHPTTTDSVISPSAHGLVPPPPLPKATHVKKAAPQAAPPSTVTHL